ncbi:spore germination protein [Paenibacillus abyssi]|uniref:Spore germination protein n=1 Tax=Paenibacillus abyssi TaxID=1340531 RepID=A0A917FXT3_9BACL|nr:spore germination protein [Paenibacillus abyssi]GGG13397.1 spore germination protein [Paenibacillus abyssi]
MINWKTFKKYIITDLSEKQPSFSLGHWEDKPRDGTQKGEADVKTERLPQIDSLIEDLGTLPSNLTASVDWFKLHFSYPQNRGLVVRRVVIGHTSFQAAVIFLEGLVDWAHLNRSVLVPLMTMDVQEDFQPDASMLIQQFVTEGQVSESSQLRQIANDILKGSAVLLVDGLNAAIIVEVKGWEKKAIDNPKTEIVVRGPHEGFTEDIQTNLSMIRRRLRTPDLLVEMGYVGTLSRTEIAVVYIKSIANAELVENVRQRIAAIQYDYIGDSGTIEQLIEENNNSFYPSIMSTERPDRVSAQIAEGFVGIIVDNSPFALIVPGHFPLFLQTAEDAYLRWPYSTFLRIVRTIGFFISLYLPAVYVAIANYHQEMMPTTLILAIAGTRESVPIPVAAEAFMLESMFELIREAGVRIPSVIGPTIGIVGALILGQAAVQANIVSPIVVIITSTTALASYTIPNYNMQFATRILRFIYLLSASFLGLIGIVMVSIILWSFRAASNSFGVPNLSPITPHKPSNDTIIRGSIKKQKYRPITIRPKQIRKVSDIEGGSENPTKDQGGAKK